MCVCICVGVYACTRIDVSCVVSFIFKINYVDSKPKSAIKFHRETSRRNYTVKLLRVQSNGKSYIHMYRGYSRSLPVVRFPALRGNHVRHFASCSALVSSFFSFAALNALTKVPQQIGCFIEQYRDSIDEVLRSGLLQSLGRRLNVFSVCFVCSSPSGTSSL